MSAQPVQQRRIEYVPLGDIKRARRNPKLHDDEAIKASLARFGIGELPLLDERTGLLVAGEGRINQLEALRETDPRTPPDGIEMHASGEWMVPVVRGWASRDDKEADAYLIASNRLSERGGWDGMGLAEMLSALEGELDGLGYDQHELDQLLSETGFLSAKATEFLDELASQPAPESAPVPSPAGPPPIPGFVENENPYTGPPYTGPPPPAPAQDPFSPSGEPAPQPPAQSPAQSAPEHSSALPAHAPPAAGSTEPQWFPLTWTANFAQRETILEAIRRGRDQFGAVTAVAALAAVCQQYLDGLNDPNDLNAAKPAASAAATEQPS